LALAGKPGLRRVYKRETNERVVGVAATKMIMWKRIWRVAVEGAAVYEERVQIIDKRQHRT
jgi:hypothetical protein